MKSLLALAPLALVIGCSSGGSRGADAGPANTGGSGGSSMGGRPGTGGSSGDGGGGGSTGGDGSGTGGSSTGGDSAGTGGKGGGGSWGAGNPDGSCSAGVPAEGKPADSSKPTTVVGTGTAASCTFAALSAAVTKGGVVTFDCGDGPVTIPVTATLKAPTDKDTVIDGNKVVTLDGQGRRRNPGPLFATAREPGGDARQAWTESFESVYVRAMQRKDRRERHPGGELAGVNRRFLQRLMARLGLRGGEEEDEEWNVDFNRWRPPELER